MTRAVREYREPKDGRFKAGFRDVCEPCYERTLETVVIDGHEFKRVARRLIASPGAQSEQVGT